MKAKNFETHCLEIIDEVCKTGKKGVITKKGVPVVQVVPLKGKEGKLFGCMKGTVRVLGDINSPVEEK